MISSRIFLVDPESSSASTVMSVGQNDLSSVASPSRSHSSSATLAQCVSSRASTASPR